MGPMTEPAHFASRPWTQADDDGLRRLVFTGTQLNSDRYPDEPNRNCRPFTCQTAAGKVDKNQAETIADGLKARK
jgi:hypothetical protein